MKSIFHPALAALLLLIPLISACTTSPEDAAGQGRIYLYGETHGVPAILDRELELWQDYYHNEGLRHLFIELSYYTAEYLNLWMQAEDDEILGLLYADWTGTAMHDPAVREFYQAIKQDCPETVFHGTDVGHQYRTTGQRYMRYLVAHGLEDTLQCALTQEAIDQGRHYQTSDDQIYRENTMVENFVREFDALGGESVMGIYGSAHTDPEVMDYFTGSVPCMAGQLYEIYGDALHTEDLSESLKDAITRTEPLGTDTITVDGTDYEATYYGTQDMSSWHPEFVSRDFWRLEDAYADFSDRRLTGDKLSYSNYPTEVETGQVFVIDYTRADGTVERWYYRSDGNTFGNEPTTEQFVLR